jgi:hypothetical protein
MDVSIRYIIEPQTFVGVEFTGQELSNGKAAE